MEIFMSKIPSNFDKYHVKGVLAEALHGPEFFNEQINFGVHLFQPKAGELNRTGILMIPDLRVGTKFLGIYGTNQPSMFLWADGAHRIHFFMSKRPPPSPEYVKTTVQTPWVDPAREREREEKERTLTQMFVSLRSIQFGWMCRDDVFSIESEARQIARLRFDPSRRELQVAVSEGYDSEIEYVIAIRQSTILRLSCHPSQFDDQTVIFLQLEIPPVFFERHIPFPGEKKSQPLLRLTTFPLVNNIAAIAYTSLAIRLVFLSSSGAEAFDRLSGLTGLRNMVKSFPVRVERRDLFSRNRLQIMDISIRQLDSWPVAFQLEALVRNLYVDPQEIVEFIPRVKELMGSYGKPFVAKLLQKFAPRAKEFLFTSETSSLLSCFSSFVEEFRAQGDLGPTTPEDSNFSASMHVIITPTSLFLRGPHIDKSNRVLRRYSPTCQENFIRVEFRDENSLQYRFDKDVDAEAFIKTRLGPIMRDGLVIAGRRFVKSFNDPKHGIVTADKIIKSLGTFKDLPYDRTLELCPARYGARISQAFSATDAAVVDVDEIIICDDITTSDGGYIFTDGSGGMSKDLAREIWSRVGRKRDRIDFPHAYQIRFQGSKGMISVDYTLNGSNALSLRHSMIKFDDPNSTEIEISRAIDQPTTYYLNRPLIMILEGLGVEYPVFQRFQDRAIRETKEAMQSLSAAAHLLQTHGLGIAFRLSSTMSNLAKLDLEHLAQDIFLNQILRLGVYHVLRDLKYRARIPIPNAWTLVGVADTHRYLKEKEVFVCIRHIERGTFFLEGPVLVSRSPTIHPGDVQLARAIGPPPRGSCFAKEQLPNTIVFSVVGERPLPTCLGGGDLDGDLYNIISLNDHPYFAPKRTYKPADYLAAEKEFLDRPCNMMDVAEFVMKYIVSDVVGIVATNWLIIADQKGNITNSECLELAKLHSDAVDYQKTGRQVNLDDIPRPGYPLPDWNAPETIDNMPEQQGRFYPSTTALGKLTRNIDLKAHEPTIHSRIGPRRTFPRAASCVDDVADEITSLDLGDKAITIIRDVLKPLVAQFIGSEIRTSSIITGEIRPHFRRFADELREIAERNTLSHRSPRPLLEEELITGTITQKTSQPRLRKDKITNIKDSTDYACRNVRDSLEKNGDSRPPKEQLCYAWNAWMLSVRELKKGTYGAKAFWWVTIGAVFEAMKEVEEEEAYLSVIGGNSFQRSTRVAI